MVEEKSQSGNIFDLDVIGRLFAYVRPYRWSFYGLIFLTIFGGIIAPVRPYLIQYTTDKHFSTGDYQGLLYITLALIGLVFLQAIVEYLSTFVSGWLGQLIIKDIRVKLYEHLLKFKLSFYDKTPIGRLITRNISDIETISDVFTEGLADMAGSVLQLVCILGFMFYIDWRLTLISLSVIPFLLLSTYVFKEKVKKSFNDVRSAVANLNTFVQEHITGMNIVQIFNSEKIEYNKFEKINSEHKKANLKSVLYYSVYFPVAEVLSAIGVGLLVWWGTKGVLDGVYTMGTIIAFVIYIQMFFKPIREIADKYNTLQMGIVGSSRVLNLLENTENVESNGDYISKEIKGNIRFQDVWFGYDEKSYVLKGVSFEVKQGQTVAIVGATGAGKSSIVNLLNRFYDIQKGQITLDDVNISTYDLSCLRAHVGVIMQDVFLFSNSIYENINLGNSKLEAATIQEATRSVGAEKFIAQLPLGYDYAVMERGATLSVGQRQLIAFIRAMAYNPRILILDEATSSVDSETEELIQNALLKLLQGRTSIVIAHRLSTIKGADKIIVLDKGQIKETGTHDELLLLNGYYANLYQMQFQNLK